MAYSTIMLNFPLSSFAHLNNSLLKGAALFVPFVVFLGIDIF